MLPGRWRRDVAVGMVKLPFPPSLGGFSSAFLEGRNSDQELKTAVCSLWGLSQILLLESKGRYEVDSISPFITSRGTKAETAVCGYTGWVQGQACLTPQKEPSSGLLALAHILVSTPKTLAHLQGSTLCRHARMSPCACLHVLQPRGVALCACVCPDAVHGPHLAPHAGSAALLTA